MNYFIYRCCQVNIHASDMKKLQSVWDKLRYILFFNSRSENRTRANHEVGNEWKFVPCSPLYAFMFSDQVPGLLILMKQSSYKNCDITGFVWV